MFTYIYKDGTKFEFNEQFNLRKQNEIEFIIVHPDHPEFLEQTTGIVESLTSLEIKDSLFIVVLTKDSIFGYMKGTLLPIYQTDIVPLTKLHGLIQFYIRHNIQIEE